MTDIIPKKSLGQHWLHDQASLEAMVEAGGIKKSDTVLEIGPGLGTLTDVLIKKSDKIIAVEFDNILAVNLADKYKLPQVEIINQDILSFDFTSLPASYKIVANIPYYLTSHLIRVISETPNPPSQVALLIQKEVAERVAAKPGDMSLLSVTAQFYWQVELGRLVPARLFTPPPKVDSQILILKRRSKNLFNDIDTDDFFRLVKAGFSQRRKTLLNSLSAGLHADKTIISVAAQAVDIDPGRRPQTLSIEDWHNLYLSLNT